MGRRGFTLIEVMVAFAILMLALGTLLPVFGQMLDRGARGQEEVRAAALAQSLLDRVGADLPLTDGRTDGEAEGFGWHLLIRPHGNSEDQANWVATAHEVELTVAWHVGGRVREERFSTIRLGPRPAAP
jgi:general secretion pathway protein I